jgi:hypothetical protein
MLPYNHGDERSGKREREFGESHELDAPPWLRVESTLMATAQAIREAYDVRLAPIGLTLSLASLLSYIAEFGPVNQTRAAEHLGQGRAATGAQVDRLQALGLIERRPDPDDRRVWMVAITPPASPPPQSPRSTPCCGPSSAAGSPARSANVSQPCSSGCSPTVAVAVRARRPHRTSP